MASTDNRENKEHRENKDNRRKPNTSANSAAHSSSHNKSRANDHETKVDIFIIAYVLVMVLLFLCNFHIIGVVGDSISGFLFGVFGWLAYITPLFAIAILFIYRAVRDDYIRLRKLYTSIVLYFLIAIICDLASGTAVAMEAYNFSELYKLGRDGRCGGGLLSGSIAFLIKKGLGTVGLVLFLIAGIIICLVLITGKTFIASIVEWVKGQFDKADERKEISDRNREERARVRAEKREIERQENSNRALNQRDKLKAIVNKDNDQENADNQSEVYELPDNSNNPVNDEYIPESYEEEAPDTGYKLNARDKFKAKLAADKEKREQKKLLKKEAIQNDEILQIAPPLPQNYGRGYVPEYSGEMHEVQYSEQDYYAEPEYPAYENEASEEVYDNNPVMYDNLGRARHNIKKQEIKTQHTVTYNEQYEPMDGYDEVVYEEESPSLVDEPDYDKLSFGKQESIFTNEHINSESVNDNYVKPVAVKPQVDAANKETPPAFVKEKSYSNKAYQFPPMKLLKFGTGSAKSNRNELEATGQNLENTLKNFGVSVHVTEAVQGPSVTRYEMTLEPGIKVSKILGLADDIKLSLACADVRIEAPIPGKSAVGIEVPNKENSMVALRDLLDTKDFKEAKSTLSFGVGKNIGGEVIVTDIAKMPHVLIAGTTGSGKSVCINTLIMSILYKSSPEDVQLIMVDPKVVELSVYNGIPHLMLPVVTDPKKAAGALAWGVKEMEDRYRKFADLNVRDLAGYNEKILAEPEKYPEHFKLPKIVIIIDELADLMMVCGKEVEESICRLAQLARACGIHLVVATQRPSVDVITGLIKANMPSRIAFAVSNGVDSRTILDQVGAEKLLGKGDMLFFPQGKTKPERVQGAFVSDEEVSNVVDFLKNQRLHNTFAERKGITDDVIDLTSSESSASKSSGSSESSDGRDELFADAGRCIINSGKASIGYLQRMLKIGFNRAARIMDSLAEEGVVGPESGTKAREILMTIEEFESYIDND